MSEDSPEPWFLKVMTQCQALGFFEHFTTEMITNFWAWDLSPELKESRDVAQLLRYDGQRYRRYADFDSLGELTPADDLKQENIIFEFGQDLEFVHFSVNQQYFKYPRLESRTERKGELNCAVANTLITRGQFHSITEMDAYIWLDDGQEEAFIQLGLSFVSLPAVPEILRLTKDELKPFERLTEDPAPPEVNLRQRLKDAEYVAEEIRLELSNPVWPFELQDPKELKGDAQSQSRVLSDIETMLCSACGQVLLPRLRVEFDGLPDDFRGPKKGELEIALCGTIECLVMGKGCRSDFRDGRDARSWFAKRFKPKPPKVFAPRKAPALKTIRLDSCYGNEGPGLNSLYGRNLALKTAELQDLEEFLIPPLRGNKVGGWPRWSGNTFIPKCKRCTFEPTFWCQLSVDDLDCCDVWSEGTLYVFGCLRHPHNPVTVFRA